MRIAKLILTLCLSLALGSCEKKKENSEPLTPPVDIPKVERQKADLIEIKEPIILPNGRIATEDSKRQTIYKGFLRKYYRLMEFKNESTFALYGFALDNSYRYWIQEVRKAKKEQDSQLLLAWGLSFNELEDLAMTYALSKGKETEETETINDRFNRIFKQIRQPKIGPALIDYDLDTPIDTTINSLEGRMADYRSRIIALNELLDVYPSKRDSVTEFMGALCLPYFQLLLKLRSLNEPRVDSLKNTLTTYDSILTDNQRFINTILTMGVDTTLFTFEKPFAPIMHYPSAIPGIYGIDDDYALRNNRPNPVAKEAAILKESSYSKASTREYFDEQLNKVVYLEKTALDSIEDARKTVYVYSKTRRHKTQINRLGRYASECDNGFFYYDLKIDSTTLKTEDLLFSSTFPLDLEYGNYPKIDSLIYTKYPDICADCPSSFEFQTTFAKLQGFDNLYLTYAQEEGKGIDRVSTPMRSLIYIKDEFFVYLWSESIDSFGCSCL